MEMKKIKKQATVVVQKYKYVILVILIGIALMLVPSSGNRKKTALQNEQIPITQGSIQEELENILSQIAGAGSVRVMLKEKNGQETIYQTNEDLSDNRANNRIETVIITDSNRNECGLIKQINPPAYVGAIILCQGAENPSVKYAVADAVSKITGLGLDKIAVFKMK